jgi:hypothetical protein
MALHDRVVLFGGRKSALVGATVELGDDPIVELDRDTADRIGVATGDLVSIFFPISDAGQAEANASAREALHSKTRALGSMM